MLFQALLIAPTPAISCLYYPLSHALRGNAYESSNN